MSMVASSGSRSPKPRRLESTPVGGQVRLVPFLALPYVRFGKWGGFAPALGDGLSSRAAMLSCRLAIAAFEHLRGVVFVGDGAKSMGHHCIHAPVQFS